MASFSDIHADSDNIVPSRAPTATRGRTAACWGAVVIILAVHWAAGFTATFDKSLTYDEGAHLFSGVVYWLRGDFRFQCENGNLPQRWCAIPAVLSGQTRLPDSQLPFWKDAQPREGANSYLYDSGNDAAWTIRAGRGMCGIWGVLVCLAVFVWSKKLFGTRGAFVSLVSCAACPTLLANGPLMTSDTCLTLFLLLSTAAIWQVLHRANCWTVLFAALALSGLFLAKTSAILIFPIAAVLVVARLRTNLPFIVDWFGVRWEVTKISPKLAAIAGAAAVCGMAAWAAVWGAYDFRFAPTSVESSSAEYLRFGNLERLSSELSPKQASVIRSLAKAKLLPEPYLYGAAYVAAHSERIAFLNGEYSLSGFRGFFPYTFLMKTPLAMLGLLAAAALALRRSSKETTAAWWYLYTPLWRLHDRGNLQRLEYRSSTHPADLSRAPHTDRRSRLVADSRRGRPAGRSDAACRNGLGSCSGLAKLSGVFQSARQARLRSPASCGKQSRLGAGLARAQPLVAQQQRIQ